jgi:mannose-6-phosphate isomerase-like protein (cupin superfamily)
MKLDVHPLLLRPGEGEAITEKPERTVRLLLAHDLLDVTWSRYEQGEQGPDPHVHREHVDSFFVLEGELVFGLGPDVEDVRAPAGTFVFVPQDVVHTFRNDGEATTLFLNLHSPSGGFAAFMRGERDGFDSFDPPPGGGRPAGNAIVSAPGAGERFEREDRVNTIRGALPEISAFQLEVEPVWDGVAAHAHADQVDMFFVLEGEPGLVVGDDVVRAEAGSFYAAVPGARHGLQGSPSRRVVFLNVHAPDGGFAERVVRSG